MVLSVIVSTAVGCSVKVASLLVSTWHGIGTISVLETVDEVHIFDATVVSFQQCK